MIEVVSESEITGKQQEFIEHWITEYFSEFDQQSHHDKAEVNWRLFLSHRGQLTSHLTLSELQVDIGNKHIVAGAIGSLFTAKPYQGQGHANRLLDFAEDFLLQQLQSKCGILFCLGNLVPFYERRGWQLFTGGVAFNSHDGSQQQWKHSAMFLSRSAFPNPSDILVVKA